MDDLNVRDLFAMMAMCGMAANKGLGLNAEEYSKISYVIADAMMKKKEERDAKPSD
jgi:hypothetical protein